MGSAHSMTLGAYFISYLNGWAVAQQQAAAQAETHFEMQRTIAADSVARNQGPARRKFRKACRVTTFTTGLKV